MDNEKLKENEIANPNETEKNYNALVNPTFETAKITSFLLSQAGDDNAKRFVEILGFKDPFANSTSNLDISELFQILTAINIEARYRAVEANLKESELDNLVDLACGFTPRGLDAQEAGINYIGIDVPVVVDELTSNFNKLGENEQPEYIVADATNFPSLKKATDKLDGELFISSEGLLTYLNESELEQVVSNIRNILLEHGGYWFTTDASNLMFDAIKLLVAEDPSLKAQLDNIFAYLNQSRGIYIDSTQTTNETMTRKAFEDNGLNIVEVDYYSDEFPVKLLNALPEGQREIIDGLLHNLKAWKLTPKLDEEFESDEIQSTEPEDWHIDYSVDNDTMNLVISGRLDNLSAPEFLEIYDKNKTDSLKEVIIDAQDLAFTSSTGLRVLQMMVNDLGSLNVKIKNAQPKVLETLESEGFSDKIEII